MPTIVGDQKVLDYIARLDAALKEKQEEMQLLYNGLTEAQQASIQKAFSSVDENLKHTYKLTYEKVIYSLVDQNNEGPTQVVFRSKKKATTKKSEKLNYNDEGIRNAALSVCTEGLQACVAPFSRLVERIRSAQADETNAAVVSHATTTMPEGIESVVALNVEGSAPLVPVDESTNKIEPEAAVLNTAIANAEEELIEAKAYAFRCIQEKAAGYFSIEGADTSESEFWALLENRLNGAMNEQIASITSNHINIIELSLKSSTDEATLESALQVLKDQINTVVSEFDSKLTDLVATVVEQLILRASAEFIEQLRSEKGLSSIWNIIKKDEQITAAYDALASEGKESVDATMALFEAECHQSLTKFAANIDLAKLPLVQLSIKGQEKKLDVSNIFAAESFLVFIKKLHAEVELKLSNAINTVKGFTGVDSNISSESVDEDMFKEFGDSLLFSSGGSSNEEVITPQPHESSFQKKVGKPADTVLKPKPLQLDENDTKQSKQDKTTNNVLPVDDLHPTLEKLLEDPMFKAEESQNALRKLAYNLAALKGESATQYHKLRKHMKTSELAMSDSEFFVKLNDEEKNKYQPLNGWVPDYVTMEKVLNEVEQAFAKAPADYTFWSGCWYNYWVPVLNVLIDLVNLILSWVPELHIEHASASAAQEKFKESGLRASVLGLFAKPNAAAEDKSNKAVVDPKPQVAEKDPSDIQEVTEERHATVSL